MNAFDWSIVANLTIPLLFLQIARMVQQIRRLEDEQIDATKRMATKRDLEIVASAIRDEVRHSLTLCRKRND